MSKPQGYRQAAAEACFCLLVLCLPYWQSLLLAGMSGALSVLLLTCLLMFVAGRSPEVFATIAGCLRDLPLGWVVPRLACEDSWVARPLHVVADGPSLEAWFQRPPPFFS